MCYHTEPSSSPYRSKPSRPGSQACGYALLVVMIMATVLLVSLTAALPSIYQEGQREREEELIFRGTQYARAIALFRRQFQRYPTEVKELLETNRMHFLRKAYPDPMTRKGKWRFIHANAAGVILDSKLRSLAPAPGAAPGTPPATSQNPPTGEAAATDSQQSSAFFGGGQEIRGAFIVGVASTSRRESVRVWNKKTHYDEWEFLGVDMSVLGLPAGIPGQPGVTGQPGLGGQPPAGGQFPSPGTPMVPGRPLGPGFPRQ